MTAISNFLRKSVISINTVLNEPDDLRSADKSFAPNLFNHLNIVHLEPPRSNHLHTPAVDKLLAPRKTDCYTKSPLKADNYTRIFYSSATYPDSEVTKVGYNQQQFIESAAVWHCLLDDKAC